MKNPAAIARPLLLPLVTLLSVTLMSGCGGNALAGDWTEEGAGGAARELSFADDGQLMVHAHGRADGGPEHMKGSWKLEGDRLVLRWTDERQQVEMRGTLHDNHLELEGPDGETIAFHRGGSGNH